MKTINKISRISFLIQAFFWILIILFGLFLLHSNLNATDFPILDYIIKILITWFYINLLVFFVSSVSFKDIKKMIKDFIRD